MRFLDANVFIYAFYKPKKALTPLEKRMKDLSKSIIADVGEGKDPVVTTVVHISGMVNILKHALSISEIAEIVTTLSLLDSVDIASVDKMDYLAATKLGQDLGLDPNDALAVQVLRLRGLSEIYSFDRVFERVEGVRRLPVL